MSKLTREDRQAIKARSVPWTPQQDADFRRMWADGAPIRAIGAAIGKSHNSVASRRSTLGLPPRENAQKEHALLANRLKAHQHKRHPKNNNPTGATVARIRAGRPPAPKPAPLPTTALVVAPVSIVDLGHAQCRYIGERPALLTLETPIYCGARTDGGSWCPAHRARVLVPARMQAAA